MISFNNIKSSVEEGRIKQISGSPDQLSNSELLFEISLDALKGIFNEEEDPQKIIDVASFTTTTIEDYIENIFALKKGASNEKRVF